MLFSQIKLRKKRGNSPETIGITNGNKTKEAIFDKLIDVCLFVPFEKNESCVHEVVDGVEVHETRRDCRISTVRRLVGDCHPECSDASNASRAANKRTSEQAKGE